MKLHRNSFLAVGWNQMVVMVVISVDMPHISVSTLSTMISLSFSRCFFVIRAIQFRWIGGILSLSRLVGAKPPPHPTPLRINRRTWLLKSSLSSGSCLFDYLSPPLSLAFCGLFDHANGNQYDASIHHIGRGCHLWAIGIISGVENNIIIYRQYMLGITAGEICPRKSCSINGRLRSYIKNCPLSRDVLVNVNLLLLWKMSTIFVLNTRCARVPSVSSVCATTPDRMTQMLLYVFSFLFSFSSVLFYFIFFFVFFISKPLHTEQDKLLVQVVICQCRCHFEFSSCIKE